MVGRAGCAAAEPNPPPPLVPGAGATAPNAAARPSCGPAALKHSTYGLAACRNWCGRGGWPWRLMFCGAHRRAGSGDMGPRRMSAGAARQVSRASCTGAAWLLQAVLQRHRGRVALSQLPHIAHPCRPQPHCRVWWRGEWLGAGVLSRFYARLCKPLDVSQLGAHCVAERGGRRARVAAPRARVVQSTPPHLLGRRVPCARRGPVASCVPRAAADPCARHRCWPHRRRRPCDRSVAAAPLSSARHHQAARACARAPSPPCSRLVPSRSMA